MPLPGKTVNRGEEVYFLSSVRAFPFVQTKSSLRIVQTFEVVDGSQRSYFYPG